MTNTNQARTPDSDRVDGGRHAWRAVVGYLLVGLIVGGLLGSVYGATRPRSFQASTALSVLPDPVLNTTSQTNNNAVTQDATAFIQTELVVLNSAQLAAQVQAKLGLAARPDVTSTQMGQTYVVQVTATSGSSAQAVDIARATGSAYATMRKNQLSTEIKALQGATRQQLATVRSSLTSTKASATTALSPSQTALQTEYERLLSVQSNLNTTLAQVGTVVRVLTPARVTTGTLSTALKSALVGALVGALLALALLLSVRRAVPRVRGIADLADLGIPVLLPLLPTRSLRAIRAGREPRSSQARLLAARMQVDMMAGDGPVVVAGTTPAAGGSSVAAALATALVDRAPVLLVTDGSAASASSSGRHTGSVPAPDDGPDDRHADPYADGAALALPSSVSGVWIAQTGASPDSATSGRSARQTLDLVHTAVAAGWLVVVDAPALSESDLALDCADRGGLVALVVGRGATKPADVLGAVELLDVRRIPVAGVILNDAPGSLRRKLIQWFSDGPSIRPAAGHGRPVDELPWGPDRIGSTDARRVATGTAGQHHATSEARWSAAR